jgi:ComF family protein
MSEKKCQRCSSSPAIRLYSWGKYDGELVEYISIFKFRGVLELGIRLADEAILQLAESLRENKYDCVIPVPLHKSRHRRREYNQSEIIALRVSEAIGVKLLPDSVLRVRSTRQQSKIDNEENRWRNVKDAFSLAEGGIINFDRKRVLVVDDIVTTGATIFEASRPIMEQNPELLDVFSVAYAG